jgi:hypothetical protein
MSCVPSPETLGQNLELGLDIPNTTCPRDHPATISQKHHGVCKVETQARCEGQP